MKILQLKITIKYSKPAIWRRVEVASEITLQELHYIIQTIMPWTDSHLHEFRQGERIYGNISQLADWEMYDDMSGEITDYTKIKISKLLKKEKDNLVYIYDFGDDWEHYVLLEAILPDDGRVEKARFVKGKNAAPVEDCGGIRQYYKVLEMLKRKEGEEYLEHLEYLGLVEDEFDPTDIGFEAEEINEELADWEELIAGFNYDREDSWDPIDDEEWTNEDDDEDWEEVRQAAAKGKSPASKEILTTVQKNVTLVFLLSKSAMKEDIVTVLKAMDEQGISQLSKWDLCLRLAKIIQEKGHLFLDTLSIKELLRLEALCRRKTEIFDWEFSGALEQLGLALYDEEKVAYGIPIVFEKEVRTILSDYLKDSPELAIKKRVEEVLLGLLNLYGVLEVSQFLNLAVKYGKLANLQVGDSVFGDSMLFFSNYLEKNISFRLNSFKNCGEVYFFSPMIPLGKETAQQVLTERRVEHMAELAEFSLEQVVAAGKSDGHMELKFDATKSLMELICKYKPEFKEYHFFIGSLWQLINMNESIPEIVSYFIQRLEINLEGKKTDMEFGAIMAELTTFMNNIPLWALNGLTSDFVFHKCEQPALQPLNSDNPFLQPALFSKSSRHPISGKEVGRNDFCPCGSGKKYIKCCGKDL